MNCSGLRPMPSTSFRAAEDGPPSTLTLTRRSFSKSQPNAVRPNPWRFGSINCNSSVSLISTTTTTCFTWDDVVRVLQPHYSPGDDASDLRFFFEKIKLCNRGSEKQAELLPFVIEEQVVGFVHNSFADNLRRYEYVIIFPQDDSYGGCFGICVKLHPKLKTPEDRTRAVNDVIMRLGQEGVIPGLRHELYPVTSSFGAPVFFSLERAAAP